MGLGDNLLDMAVSALSKPNVPPPAPAPAPPAPPDMGAPNAMAGAPNPGAYGSLAAPPVQPTAPPAGETKGHKLLQILQGGIQGALAGRASSEQALIQSGGHRSGGAGMGFQAGYELPWQHAMQGQQLAQAQAQTELTKQQGTMVNIPGIGPVPAGLAKVLYPSIIGAGAKTGAAQIGADARETAAQTRAGATTQAATIGAGGRTQAATIGADARVKAAAMGLGPLADVSPELQQQLGLPAKLPLKMLNQAESAANKPLTVVAGENDSYVVNKQTNAKTPLGVGNRGAGTAMARGVQVADDANPGNTKYTTMGNAIKSGAAGAQSASVQVPKTAMKAEVPTKIGDLKVNFTTMNQHADLLRQAVKGLQNGDQQTLNGLKNRFKTEFGYSGPITAEAIADAYKGEVTNVINKGHITDKGSEKVAHTLDPSKQNYQTMDSVLGAYQALAQSKMNMLTQQEKAAISSSQRKPAGGGASASGGQEIHYKVVNGQLVKQ